MEESKKNVRFFNGKLSHLGNGSRYSQGYH